MDHIPPEARKALQRSLLGVPQSGLPDRTFVRHQGCWNCVNAKTPVDRWRAKREQKLNYALQIAAESFLGENHPEVVKVRRTVELIDDAVRQGSIFVCDVGRTATGEPVADFTTSAFLCDRWSGRDGASLARADNGKLDELPEELRERIDGPDPITPAQLIEQTKGTEP